MIKIGKTDQLLFANGCLFILSVSNVIYLIANGHQSSNDFEFGCFVSYFHAIIINDGGLHSSNVLSFFLHLLLSCAIPVLMGVKLERNFKLRPFLKWCCVSLVTMLVSISSFYIFPNSSFVIVGFPLPFLCCCHCFYYAFELLEYRILSLLFIVIDILSFYVFDQYFTSLGYALRTATTKLIARLLPCKKRKKE